MNIVYGPVNFEKGDRLSITKGVAKSVWRSGFEVFSHLFLSRERLRLAEVELRTADSSLTTTSG